MIRSHQSSSGAWAGAAVLASVLAAGLAAPWLAGNPSSTAGAALLPPQAAHPFGTDDLGRDLFAGVLHGTEHSLRVGFVSAGIAALLGVLIGGLGAIRGGAVDGILTRATEFVQALPRFFLAITIVGLFGRSTWVIVAVLGLTAWPATARLFRALVLSAIERDFAVAARAAGARDLFVLLHHALPLASAPLAAQVAHQAGAAILAETALSFVGLGDPHAVSWGTLLAASQHFVRDAWWMSVFPGAAVTLTVAACNLIADTAARPASARG